METKESLNRLIFGFGLGNKIVFEKMFLYIIMHEPKKRETQLKVLYVKKNFLL